MFADFGFAGDVEIKEEREIETKTGRREERKGRRASINFRVQKW